MIVHFFKYGTTACLLPGNPFEWPPNHQWVSDGEQDKVTCPACLEGLKYGDPTFEILEDGKAIKCRRCKMVSHHPKDVEHHYCGHCGVSHDDLWPPARRAWVDDLRDSSSNPKISPSPAAANPAATDRVMERNAGMKSCPVPPIPERLQKI
jgi:ribosomal protein L37E